MRHLYSGFHLQHKRKVIVPEISEIGGKMKFPSLTEIIMKLYSNSTLAVSKHAIER